MSVSIARNITCKKNAFFPFYYCQSKRKTWISADILLKMLVLYCNGHPKVQHFPNHWNGTSMSIRIVRTHILVHTCFEASLVINKCFSSFEYSVDRSETSLRFFFCWLCRLWEDSSSIFVLVLISLTHSSCPPYAFWMV